MPGNEKINLNEGGTTAEKKVDHVEASKSLEGVSMQAFMQELKAAETLPPLASELTSKEESLGVTLPPEKRKAYAEAGKEIEMKMLAIKLKGNEEEFLLNEKSLSQGYDEYLDAKDHPEKYKKTSDELLAKVKANMLSLEEKYSSSESSPKAVLEKIGEFADKVGVEKNLPQEFAGQKFSNETASKISAIAEERIGKYLLNKETGRYNPAKHETLIKQTNRYLELLVEAQAEGDVEGDLSLEDAAKMVNENIDKLAYQDRVAAENMLGDHGIRHLVNHNIVVSEKIFDKLAARGQSVKAIDRLMSHQIMIDHDLGYAMSVVRDRINAEGIRGQDAGHNLLSAKFTGERLGNPDDHFNKIFKMEHVEQIHSGELNHDSSTLEFTIGDNSPAARRKNLESAIHLADNTHAFEDKLPELLYSVPETLKYMRLMKVAGETGNEEQVGLIKQKLAEHIQGNQEFSADDKEALMQAVKGVTAETYRFNVGRICGNKPEFDISESGKIEITVQESAIHREIISVFDQDALKQLKKFIKDLGGPKDIPQDATSIDTEKILFKLATGEEGKSGDRNDYQERVLSLISEEKFRAFVIDEADLAHQQETLEALLKLDLLKKEPRDKFLAAGAQLNASDGVEMAKLAIESKIFQIKRGREKKLETYLNEDVSNG